MTKTRKSAFGAFFLLVTTLFFCNCNTSDEQRALQMIEEIKKQGNSNPQAALERLDSLNHWLKSSDEHVRMRRDLLEVRLHDKAYDAPTDDSIIGAVVAYFEEHGTQRELQEAYYYAGSVHRDLEHFPQALDYFSRASVLPVDSMILLRTYAQLHLLYYYAQNYQKSLEMARKELEVAQKIDDVDAITLMDVAVAEQYINDSKKKLSTLDTTLKWIKQTNSQKKYLEILYSLLLYYSNLGALDKANECMVLISSVESDHKSCINYHHALAMYYKLQQKTDSAISFLKVMEEDTTSITRQYLGALELTRIYANREEYMNATEHFSLFLALFDSIRSDQKFHEAQLTHEMFQFHQIQVKEHELNEQHIRFQMTIYSIIGGILVVSLLLALAFSLYRLKKTRRILQQQQQLRKLRALAQSLNVKIEQKEQELREKQNNYEKNQYQLQQIKGQMLTLESQLETANSELVATQKQLEERLAQVRDYVKRLHLTSLEEKAEDIMQLIQNSIKGKHRLTVEEWKKVYGAVDELYPDFKMLIATRLGIVTEDQKHICYLLRIELSNPEIRKITDIPNTSLWRWAKEFREKLGLDDSSNLILSS